MAARVPIALSLRHIHHPLLSSHHRSNLFAQGTISGKKEYWQKAGTGSGPADHSAGGDSSDSREMTILPMYSLNSGEAFRKACTTDGSYRVPDSEEMTSMDSSKDDAWWYGRVTVSAYSESATAGIASPFSPRG